MAEDTISFQAAGATTRNAILDAAEQLFAEHGFEATTTRMLAQASNTNLAMISYHFGGKEKLMEALLRRRMQDTGTALQQAMDAPNISATEKMKLIADAYLEKVVRKDRCITRIMSRELSLDSRPASMEVASNVIMENRRRIAEVIRQGIATGEFRKVDPEMCTHMLMGAIMQYNMSPYLSIRLMEGDPETDSHTDEPFLERLRNHLHSFITLYLQKPTENTAPSE